MQQCEDCLLAKAQADKRVLGAMDALKWTKEALYLHSPHSGDDDRFVVLVLEICKLTVASELYHEVCVHPLQSTLALMLVRRLPRSFPSLLSSRGGGCHSSKTRRGNERHSRRSCCAMVR
jgi:hypothetical protein